MADDKFTWAADLPAFDENATCPKCGHDALSALYHHSATARFPCMSSSTWMLDEHLCRGCERCGFGWPEAPVNVKPARGAALRAVSPMADDKSAGPDFAEVIRTLSQLEEYASSSSGGTGGTTGYLLRFTAIEQALTSLSEVTVINSPDVRWALRLTRSRVTATSQLRTARSLLSTWGRTARPDDLRPLNEALREVRQLLTLKQEAPDDLDR